MKLRDISTGDENNARFDAFFERCTTDELIEEADARCQRVGELIEGGIVDLQTVAADKILASAGLAALIGRRLDREQLEEQLPG